MFVIRRATTWSDAAGMRRVRNRCCMYMTRNQNIISRPRQFWWWIRLPDTVRPFVVTVQRHVVGYGLISESGGLSGGLLPTARGSGMGEALFRFLMGCAQTLSLSPWLEVLETNLPARNLYEKLGFVERSRSDGIILLDHRDTRVRVVS